MSGWDERASDERASDEREWEDQERALREERGGRPPSGAGRIAEYRLVVRALCTPPLEPVPEDFAARTAALAEGRSAELGGDRPLNREYRKPGGERPAGLRGGGASADDRLEAGLQAGLLVFLGLAGALSLLIFGREWADLLLPPAESRGGAGVPALLGWFGALAVCFGFSLLLERWLGRGMSLRRVQS